VQLVDARLCRGKHFPTGFDRDKTKHAKNELFGFLHHKDLFSDLFDRLVPDMFFPVLCVIATAGIKTPDKPDCILRSECLCEGIVSLALDLGNLRPITLPHARNRPTACGQMR
jgi:hypothetical protein